MMRIVKLKAIAILILGLIAAVHVAFFGCNVKKNIVKNSSIEINDSTKSNVKKSSEVFDSSSIKPAVKINQAVKNPCDSNGQLKPIYQQSKSGQGKSTIRTVHDTLYVDCECDEQVNRLRVEKYASDSSYEQRLVDKQSEILEMKKVSNVIPLWCWVIMILSGIINLLLIYLFIRK